MACSKFGKIFLIIFNIIFVITGLCVFGFGLFVRFGQSKLVEVFNMVSPEAAKLVGSNLSGPLNIVAYVLIAFGLFVFLVGFCGCCGACKESGCLLLLYVIIIGIIIVAEIGVAIAMIVYKKEIDSKLTQIFFNHLKTEYKGLSEGAKTNYIQSLVWDIGMIYFHCCGTNGVKDFEDPTVTELLWNTYKGSFKIPVSCCKFKTTDFIVKGNYGEAQNQLVSKTCPVDKKEFHSMGCFQALEDFVQKQSAIIIPVAVIVVALEAISIVFAVFLRKSLNESKTV